MAIFWPSLLTWAHRNSVRLRQIGPGKPYQTAYVESFNGRLSDERIGQHWFVSLLHALTVINTWAREYNEKWPKKAPVGLTPAGYAKQLAAKATTLTLDSKVACY